MSTRKRERKRSLTADEKYERSVRARRKFKALVKLIIANRSWLEEVEDEKLGDNVKKNIKMLTRRKGQKSLLTLREKAMLNKPQELRTEAEKNHLKRIIGGLKCFRRYPPDVKNQLPTVMYFVYFGPNRVLVKQDYEPLNMYVILSGEVVVSKTFWDNLLKEYVTKDVLVMGPGSIVGEVSLLHGIARTATVTTLTACEFLYIKREDFDRVLKDTVLGLWKEVQENMSWFTYFDGWDEVDIRESCILSKKKYFQPDQIILGNKVGQHDYVYFITKGQCYMMEHMLTKTFYKGGVKCYKLVKHKEEREVVVSQSAALIKNLRKLLSSHRADTVASEPPSTNISAAGSKKSSYKSEESSLEDIESHFIKICTFNKLACFNVGENLENRLIIASTQTECLLMPRYFLHEKSMSTFSHIERYLNNYIPTTEKLFENFLEEKKWRRYKQNLLKQILADKKSINTNCIHNVPYSIRLAEYEE